MSSMFIAALCIGAACLIPIGFALDMPMAWFMIDGVIIIVLGASAGAFIKLHKAGISCCTLVGKENKDKPVETKEGSGEAKDDGEKSEETKKE